MGTHINSVADVMKKNAVADVAQSQINTSNQVLYKTLSDSLQKLIHKFITQSKSAKEQLHKVSDDIVKTVEEEAKIDEHYRKKMENLGEDPYREENGDTNSGDNYDEDDEYDEDEEGDEQKEGEEPGKTDEKKAEEKKPHHATRGEIIKSDEKLIRMELAEIYEHLQKIVFPEVSTEIIGKWTEVLAKLEEELEDDEKEVDLEVVLDRFYKVSLPDVPKFDPSTGDSEFEYIRAMIETAKLVKHRKQLMQYFENWRDSEKSEDSNGKKISPYTVMSSLERFAEENDLYMIFDWVSFHIHNVFHLLFFNATINLIIYACTIDQNIKV